MKGYIDDLVIEDKRFTKESVNFYESLGLIAILGDDSIKLCSTENAHITSFGAFLKLKIDKNQYSRIFEKKLIDEEETNNNIIYDEIGTKIMIEVKKTYEHIRLGILTSGGDSPGMNSAMRSIIRYSLKNNIKVFGIYRGFEGLIRGDIRSLGWDSETHFSGQSGTYLLSARSEKFKTREGRKEAAFNLLVRGITALVVIGGEGSMEGALIFKNEFKELCNELISEGKMEPMSVETIRNEDLDLRRLVYQKGRRKMNISDLSESIKSATDSVAPSEKTSLSTEKLDDVLFEYCESSNESEFNNGTKHSYELQIVCLPGTIDNDVMGTEYSLGSNTALSRVAEVVEKLISTMRSHKRVFVVECMGRNCGWITLMAGFAVDAEYIIIPEAPQKDWKKEMIKSLKTAYFNHKLNIFVFVSEGAIDSFGNRILIADIENEILKAGMEVRSLVVGHVQRGGMTTARDRFLGTIFGLKAVEYIIEGSNKPVMVANNEDEFVFVDLETVVKRAEDVKIAFSNKDYKKAFEMRSLKFQNIYKIYEKHRKDLIKKFFIEHLYPRDLSIGHIHAYDEKKLKSTKIAPEQLLKLFSMKDRPRIGILIEGTCSGGMNTVLNSLVQFGLCNNFDVFYFFNGFEGLININVRRADIFEFSLVHNQGGTVIETSSMKDIDIKLIENKIEEFKLDYLIIAGGTSNIKLARKNPKIIIIPCTLSNNFPGTDLCIGAETALNAISLATESCRLTAMSINKTVFIIEIGGGKCGFLTTIGGIACSVFDTISPRLNRLEDLILIKKKIKSAILNKRSRSIIVFRNEGTFQNTSTKDLCEIICSDEGIRYNWSVLGYLECGTFPSVTDRINARLSAYRAIEACMNSAKSGIVGMDGDQAKFKNIESIMNEYDDANDRVINPKWMRYSDVCSLLE